MFRIGVAPAAEGHSLMRRGQKPAGPVQRAAAWPSPTGLQHHESRKVLGLATDAVADPGTHAGMTEDRSAGIHHHLGRRVVEVVGVDRLDEGEVVDDAGRVREAVRHPCTRLAVALEGAVDAQQIGRILGEAVHEGEALALHPGGGDGLAVQLLQFGFGFPQLELARSAGHEQVDDVLGFGCDVQLFEGRSPRCRTEQRITREKGSQRRLAETHAASLEEMTAGDMAWRARFSRSSGCIMAS